MLLQGPVGCPEPSARFGLIEVETLCPIADHDPESIAAIFGREHRGPDPECRAAFVSASEAASKAARATSGGGSAVTAMAGSSRSRCPTARTSTQATTSQPWFSSGQMPRGQEQERHGPQPNQPNQPHDQGQAVLDVVPEARDRSPFHQ